MFVHATAAMNSGGILEQEGCTCVLCEKIKTITNTNENKQKEKEKVYPFVYVECQTIYFTPACTCFFVSLVVVEGIVLRKQALGLEHLSLSF